MVQRLTPEQVTPPPMTYVAILRSPDVPERDLLPCERQLVARIARECPGARHVASSGSSAHADCLDLFATPDDTTAGEIARLARASGFTEPVRCAAIPWNLLADPAADEE